MPSPPRARTEPSIRSPSSHPASEQESLPLLAYRILELEQVRDTDRDGFSEKQIEKLELRFVTKETFGPVQRIVYGMTSIAIGSLVAAIVALVVHRSS